MKTKKMDGSYRENRLLYQNWTKRISLIFLSGLLTCITFTTMSQQGNIWNFGVNASLDFNNLPTITTGSSAILSYEGCATMCDASGNLLFYTDGITIWDANDAAIVAGLSGNPSTAQAGIIIPRPGSTSQYYIISLDQMGASPAEFTLFDMNVGTTGGVVGAINNPMPGTSFNTTEGITVARHCNGIDYWIITHAMLTNGFRAYQVTSAGIQSPVVSNVGPTVPTIGGTSPNLNAASCMKISPSNRRLAFCVRRTSVNLFDFNPSTGVISNNVTVVSSTGRNYYGVEFSPNSDVLYYSDALTGLYKYNIPTIQTTTMATGATATNIFGALQLGPDQRIYVARDGDLNMSNLNQTALGVISSPNSFATSTYNASGFALASGTGVKGGLPNMIPSLMVPPITISGDVEICTIESTTLTAIGGTNFIWSPSIGLNTTTGATVIANPPSTQTYTVTSDLNGCTAIQEVTVTVECCVTGCPYELGDLAVTCDSIDCMCCGAPTICIPFNSVCEIQDGIIGIDFCVNYDQNFLTPTGNVTIGDVVLDGSPNAGYAINYVMTPGQLNVSIFYLPSAPVTADFQGAGEIACVEFTLSPSYTTGDVLDFTVCEVVEGFQTSVEFECGDDGSFVLLNDDILDGSLIYWNDDLRPLRYDQANPADYLVSNISGTDANCTVVNPNVSIPDFNGVFTYDINNGPSIEISRDIQGDFTSSAPCPAPIGVMPVINGMDAYWTSLVTTLNGSFVPNPYQIVAMDVNMDGFVSANDITHIQNRTIGNICEYPQAWNYNPTPSENSLDWRFIDRTTVENSPEFTVSNIYPGNDLVGYSRYNVPNIPFCLEVQVDSNGTFCTSVGNERYNGILLGDANGNWTGNTPTVIKLVNDEVFYDLSQVTADENCVLSIPVYYSSADNIMALDFSIDYDESRLTLQTIVPAVGATSQMISAFNDLNDQVLFTSYCAVPGGINLATPVYYLQFTSIDNEINPNDLGDITSFFNGTSSTSTITGGVVSCNTADVATINELANITIAPNPFESTFEIDFGTNDATKTVITVYDLQGRKKIELDCISSDKITINAEMLASGVYMVHVNEKSIGKIIKH